MRDTFEKLLATMVQVDASDLFLKVGQQPTLRVHGELRTLKQVAATDEAMQQFLTIVLSEAQRARFGTHPDLDLGYRSSTGEQYRVNCFRQRGHVGMAIRWVRGGDLSLDALHLPPVLASWAECRRGLVIVAGATGSGKSTALSSMVELMNAGRRRHIVTIEDPVEYLYEDKTCLIEQREVGVDTNSFADALRHVVRQSPDVILIGEMRDLDTMRVALAAAMTGHLVLTTLHTTDVLATVERMLNYFPPDEQRLIRVEMAQSLVGILCLRLVLATDGHGRVPASEVLSATPLVQKYLRDGDTSALADLLHSGRTPGVESFQRSLARLAQDGSITRESALAHSAYPDELELHLQGMFSGSDSVRHRPDPPAAAPPPAAEPAPTPKPSAETDADGDDGYQLL